MPELPDRISQDRLQTAQKILSNPSQSTQPQTSPIRGIESYSGGQYGKNIPFLQQTFPTSGQLPQKPVSQNPENDHKPANDPGGGVRLAPGAPVATFRGDQHQIRVGDRLPRTFDSVDAATAYARSLGQPATVINEGNNAIAVYTIDPASFKQTVGMSTGKAGAVTGAPQAPFTGSAVQSDHESDQTNVKSTNGAVQAIITQDGFQLRPGESGMYLADFAQRQGQDPQAIAKTLQQTYAGQRRAFGDGLQGITDKDQFLKQYNLGLRDTALSSLSASALDAQQRQESFKNGLPVAEASTIRDTATQLEGIDKQIDQAKDKQTMAQLSSRGRDNPGLRAVNDKVQQLEETRRTIVARYPMLERVNPKDFNQLSETEQAKVLHDACGDVLKSISTTRQDIVNGKIDLLQSSPLVAATNEGLGVQPEQAQWVAEKASSNKTWDTVGNIAPGILAAGLGIAAIPASGGLSLALTIGAAGVGVIDSARVLNNFITNQSATNTNVDLNKTLMPQDMKGNWGWVVASWVGVGLDLSAATAAARLLNAGGKAEEVIKGISKTQGIPEEVLMGAYTASNKGTSDPAILKQILTSSPPKGMTAEQVGKNVDVKVLNAEEFFKATGSKSGNAVTKLVKGEDGVLRAQVFVKEGADPSVLLEESVHISQLSDPKLTQKLAQLTEENLANWSKMTTQQKLDVYKGKVELEIDAQQRLIDKFGKSDPAYAKRVQQNLDNLQSRMVEVEAGVKNPNSVEGADWLDAAQPPRLFSKEWTGAQEAQQRGWADAEDGYRWVNKDGNLTYEARKGGLEPKRYNEEKGQFENAVPDILGARYKGKGVPSYEQWSNDSKDAASKLASDRASAALQRKELEAIAERSPGALTPAQQEELTRLRSEVNSKSEQLGELAGESHIRAKYGDNAVPIWPPAGKGSTSGSGEFDQVWRVKNPDGTEKYVVVEAKGGSSSLGTRRVEGRPAEQGSPEYFMEIVNVMSKAKNPQSREVAGELSDAVRDGKVDYLEVRARINPQGQATDIRSNEFDLSSEARIG
jgi:hypothetical protein